MLGACQGDLKFSWKSNANLGKEHCPPHTHSWGMSVATQLLTVFSLQQKASALLLLCCSFPSGSWASFGGPHVDRVRSDEPAMNCHELREEWLVVSVTKGGGGIKSGGPSWVPLPVSLHPLL